MKIIYEITQGFVVVVGLYSERGYALTSEHSHSAKRRNVLLNPGDTNIKKGTQVLVIAREQRNAEILGFYRKSSTCNNPAMKASSRSPSIAEEKSGDGSSFGNTNPMLDTDGRMVEMVVVDKFHDAKEAKEAKDAKARGGATGSGLVELTSLSALDLFERRKADVVEKMQAHHNDVDPSLVCKHSVPDDWVDHVVLVGNLDGAAHIVEALRSSTFLMADIEAMCTTRVEGQAMSGSSLSPKICIMHPSPPSPELLARVTVTGCDDIMFVHGSSDHFVDLERCNADRANLVVVLTDIQSKGCGDRAQWLADAEMIKRTECIREFVATKVNEANTAHHVGKPPIVLGHLTNSAHAVFFDPTSVWHELHSQLTFAPIFAAGCLYTSNLLDSLISQVTFARPSSFSSLQC